MVDVKEIRKLLKNHFTTTGKVTIDPASGVVHVAGDVRLKSQLSQLPVQFGHVDGEFHCQSKNLTSLQSAPLHVGGDFYCGGNQLTTLQGAPDHVGGEFYCGGNQLTTLQGAPDHVGGDFYCADNPLMSLQGAPDHVGVDFVCTYDDQLPLLRLIMYKSIRIWDAPDAVMIIMFKYAGKGKTHMLNCALELKQAGYAGNAKW
jgi:hypothetical protein